MTLDLLDQGELSFFRWLAVLTTSNPTHDNFRL